MLPLNIKKLMEYEKNTNYQWIDDCNEKTYYSPENANWFKIESYWLSKKDVHFFKSESKLNDLFFKDDKILFLVHPESIDYFSFLKEEERGPTFKGLATSSYRTILIFYGEYFFFAKLSVNKKFGNINRNIPKNEIIRSIGMNLILKNSNLSITYFPEILGVIPINLESGGMIIREIPENLLELELMPIFSLFTKQEDGRIPLLNMSKEIGFTTWIKKYIFEPFAKEYLYLAINGLTLEPHSQNLLLKIKNGKPCGFCHRDLNGFNYNLTNYSIDKLPSLGYIYKEYCQDTSIQNLSSSLSAYFQKWVIYGISEISTELDYLQMSRLFRKTLEREFLNYGIRTIIDHEYINIQKYIEKIKNKKLKNVSP